MTPTSLESPCAAGAAARSDAERYRRVRDWSLALTAPLEIEDFVVQSMPDASPAKWHLAHTTWFFETFVLERFEAGFRPFDESFRVLFNSYYNAVGEQFHRPDRGKLARPTVRRVLDYRSDVDRRIARVLDRADPATIGELHPLLEIGLQHEQQHQELLLTDLKHLFSVNPLLPAYRPEEVEGLAEAEEAKNVPLRWSSHDGGLLEIGHRGEAFAYDNEGPRHRVHLEPFSLASRPVTCGEYLEFVADGGYERPELWLAAGWDAVTARGWRAPAYWFPADGDWRIFTLRGLRRLHRDEPVCHVSFFEADAFARWFGARLPREDEWETVAREQDPEDGNFAEDGAWHPTPPQERSSSDAPSQLFGDVWEWTASPYVEYPGYRPPEGALGEYNAKFMCNQMVLRGGSFATPRGHVRATYRNFFPPEARWQFSGIRLAR